VAVSETERHMLTKRFPKVRSFCVPNGVSSDLARLQVPSTPGGRVLNFTGTFNYRPNRDAVKFFCSAVFPEILRRDGSVELQLVGRGSDSFARSLSPGLPVSGLGYVSDALEPLGKCAAVIAPFRLGAGTRIKILEAIALGKPVVATTVGAEGIDLDASSGLLIADDPSDFAEKTLLALNDPGIRDSAQKAGRTRVFADYSWESSAGKLAELIDLVVRSDSGSA
jgi:polysaccharide biosynthesis protein PslH